MVVVSLLFGWDEPNLTLFRVGDQPLCDQRGERLLQGDLVVRFN